MRNYADWVLGVIGVILSILLLWVLIWGTLLIVNMGRVFGSLGMGESPKSFEIEAAKKLDFKGAAD